MTKIRKSVAGREGVAACILVLVGVLLPPFKRCCTNWRFYEHKTYDCFCPRALGGRFLLEQG